MAAWAAGLVNDSWANSLGMEFAWIPAGDFLMGSETAHADNDEGPVTWVWISEEYWMGKHEVTQRQRAE